MSDVTFVHPDYLSNCKRWELAEDAAAGETAVKARKDQYLPRPNATDRSESNRKRYEQYIDRAVYYNATGRTLAGLCGLAFANDAEVTLPADISYAADDISGSGVGLLQHSQATLAEALKSGRAGLLTDYPTLDAPASVAQQVNAGVRPTLAFYPATAITNWRVTRVNGKSVLTFLVLKESYQVLDPSGFGFQTKTQYRVLRLDGNYTVEIWRQVQTADATKIEWVAGAAHTPLKGDGTPWTEIPFTFVGSQNNDECVDDGPLFDIATLNIAHYRNSADYEDSVYMCGQPMFYIGGLDIEWRDHLEKEGMYVGSRQVMPLPVGGTAGVLQASPNTLCKEAMSGKESQMAALGARLIHDSSVQKTARQQQSEDSVANSVLAIVCGNVSEAYTRALNWFAQFANAKGDAEFDIPTDFASAELDPQMITALMQLVQSGNLPQSDLWSRLRRAGLIEADKTDQDVRNEIEAETPASSELNLDGASTTQTDAVRTDPNAAGGAAAAAGAGAA